MKLLVLALCVACASSANIRGSSTEPQVDDLSTPVATSAPVKAPTPDAKVSTVSAATLSAIAAQAEKFDCAHAGDTMENIFLKIQKNIAGRVNNMTTACEARQNHVDATADADKAAHAASMAEEVAILRTKILAPLEPMAAELAKAKGEAQTAIAEATKENQTAWTALKLSRAKIEKLQASLADAEQVHKDTKNRTTIAVVATVANTTEEFKEAVEAAQEALDAMTVQAKEASTKTRKRCDASKGEDDVVNEKHQALVNKVTPLVAALKKCRNGGNEKKAPAASLLEVADPCEDMEGAVQEHQAAFLEIMEAPATDDKAYDGSLQQVVDKVAGKNRETILRHKACTAKAHRLSNETVGNATKEFNTAHDFAAAEKAAADAVARKSKNATDAAAYKVVTDTRTALDDEQDRLEGGDESPESGVADEAGRQRVHLKSTVEEQNDLVGTAQAGFDDEKARLNTILDAEKAKLDLERVDADSVSDKMGTSSKGAIKKACEIEHKVLNDEREKTEELYDQYFKEVGSIDVNADKVITTPPKPVPAPATLAGDDITVAKTALVVEMSVEDWREGGEALCKRNGRVLAEAEAITAKDCQVVGLEYGSKQVIIGRVPEGFGFSYQGEEPLKFMSSQAKGCKFDQFESKHKFADGFPEGQFNMLCVPKAAADAARHGHEASVAAAMDATVPEKQN